ncbi:MAG: ABC transporter permease [Alphaproteobacteria bacterium]
MSDVRGAGDMAPIVARPRERFIELLGTITPRMTVVYGILGVLVFFAIWEGGHYITPENKQKFLPSVEQVIATIIRLLIEKDYFHDILISCYRIYVSFFSACLLAVPLGVFMGCFIRLRALINPTVGGLRYLPAASFVPLLLVWFGPTDFAKMALLFIGCVFFLIALILDNALAVPKELIESALTMGAKRRQVVFGVIWRAATPAIIDSMRNMIAISWTYLVIAEIVAATDGIGAVMMRGGRFLHVDIIMGGILTIGVLGVLTDIGFRVVRRIIVPWSYVRRR